MSYEVELSPRFVRAAHRFLCKHPAMEDRYKRLVEDLSHDPFQPNLRLHRLHGKHAGQDAVSLTHAFRIRPTIVIIERRIVLLNIGSHDEVYDHGR